MNKDKRLICAIIISLFILPFLFNADDKTTSYPSYYPYDPHCRLIWDALNCLQFDALNKSHPFYQSRNEIINSSTNYLDQLYHAQDDYDANYALKWGHYWNPYTQTGLYSNLGAPYHADSYFKAAVNYYLGLGLYSVDKQQAYYNLGYAIHLIQDCTVPHHAQNDPFGKHAEYETFCDHLDLYGNFDPPESGEYLPQRDWDGKIRAGAWVHQAALCAAPYYSIIESNEYSYSLWKGIANYLMGEAVKLTAGFIFYFWQYANNLDYDSDGVPAMVEQEYNTDYTSNDTDGDLLSDLEEITLGVDGYITDPTSSDTDIDNYSDYDELYIHHTDPTNKYDSPFYFKPLQCPNFQGLSDNKSKITFSWSQPANFLSDWFYKLFRLENNTEIEIYSDSKRFFTYTPPNLTTFYSYRLYCYKSVSIRGVYSQWGGSIFSWSSLVKIKT
ncbi:MAG: hypothetical protein JXA54_12695 [Candidatus Heimdallarchaeota archaeon]|nr:hypothetical protein [Candidatus Heimdallarchaeota archaeon]